MPSLAAHLNRLTCPSVSVEHASIILCGWNAVAAIGVGRCEDKTFVCRKLLNGSIIESGFVAVPLLPLSKEEAEERSFVEKTRTALCEEPLFVR